MNKKVFLVTLCVLFIVVLMLILMSGVVSAGCCVNATGEECISDDDGQCSSGEYDAADCADLSACVQGCCCPSLDSDGVIKINYTCPSAEVFIEEDSLSLGEDCSCGDANTYTISGAVTDKQGSALVSAAVAVVGSDIITYTNSQGDYVLDQVSGGTVVLGISKAGCLEKGKILDLDSDREDVDFSLDCSCSPGDCDTDEDAYCTSAGKWALYDLSDSDEKDDYCALCSYDAECEEEYCIDNDDKCILPCTSSNDNDCYCDASQKNGLCPYMCTVSTDADCNVYSAECGDGIVTYPYETCEEDPADGQLSLCSGDDCVACNCNTLAQCGDLILQSGEDCEINTMCSDGTPCEDCQCGDLQCTDTTKIPEISAEFNYTNQKIFLSWTLPDSCKPSIGGSTVFKCKKESENDCLSENDGFSQLGSIARSLMNYSDTSITETSEYCYYVRVDYVRSDLEFAESEIQCVSTGDYYCLEPHSDEFCWDNKRARCDEDNNIEIIEDCNPAEYCVGPVNGQTNCTEEGVCDLCNGLYGMFSYLDLRIGVKEGSEEILKYCYPGTGRDVVTGCYLDRTQALFSAFDYCAEITSCYDYKSEEACEDKADPCDKNQGCEWLWLDEDSHSLGGICRPVAEELQKCEYCDEPEYNWLSPGCSPQTCDLFGECYYGGGSEPCTKSSTATCMDYSDADDCTGGQSVYVDAQYNDLGARVGGTHDLSVPSDDELGLGKCYYDSVNTICRRDADNKRDEDNNRVRDCFPGDLECEADFSNPETRIIPSTFGVYPAELEICFSTLDNYPSDELTTFFCIDKDYCYPTEEADNDEKVYSEEIEESGDYHVYYYTQDPAQNLELVKSLSISVDADKPFINITTPSEPDEYPTNEQNLTVKGETSTDSRYVCARNTNTGETTCVNNCLLTSSQTPCFSDDTGKFTLQINVGSDTLTNVVFYAEDFAGNTYQNTLLGILLDIEPPEEPIITVYAAD